MKKIKNKWRNIPALTLVLFGLLALFTGKTLAAYIERAVIDYRLATASKPFHFTSNLLTDDEVMPVYEITHDWDAGGPVTISFRLRNFKDALNVSEDDISYGVSYTTGGLPVDVLISDPALAGGLAQEKDVSITLGQGSSESLEVLVTATSTSPYKKDLKAMFVIAPAITYKVADNGGFPVAVLAITLSQDEELARVVEIEWDEGAAPDMTDALVLGASSINLADKKMTVSLNTGSLYELVFFKVDPLDNYKDITVVGVGS